MYQGLVDDMELATGDLVVFVKNKEGRWEVRRGDEVGKEIAHALREGSDIDVSIVAQVGAEDLVPKLSLRRKRRRRE